MGLHLSFFSKLIFLMEIRVKVIGFFSSFLSFYCKIMCYFFKKPSPDHWGRGSLPFLLKAMALFFASFFFFLPWSYFPSELFISVATC